MPTTWHSEILLRLFPWYPDMKPGARNALRAAFLGYAAASMSIHTFEFTFVVQAPFMNIINHVPEFCGATPKEAEEVATNIFASTMLASVAGGWLLGMLADRIGRALTLRITVGLLAALTFLCGFMWAWEWEWKWDNTLAQMTLDIVPYIEKGEWGNPLRLLLKLLFHLVKIEDPAGFGHCAPLGLTCAFTGFFFGGVWTAAAVLVGEWARDADRAKTVGAMQSGWVAGGLAAFLVLMLLNWFAGLTFMLLNWFGLIWSDKVHEEIACRCMLWAGLAPVVLVLFIRRWSSVNDAQVFKDVRSAGMTKDVSATLWERVASWVEDLRTWAVISVLSSGAMMGYYAITTRLPAYLPGCHPLPKSWFFVVFMFGSFIGYHAGAWVSDRYGRHYAFALFAALASLFTAVLCALPPQDAQSQLLWVLLSGAAALALTLCLGLCVSAVFSGMGAFLTEHYETAVRGRRQGSSYNIGREFAYNITLISVFKQLNVELPEFVMIAYLLVIISALLLNETAGRPLK